MLANFSEPEFAARYLDRHDPARAEFAAEGTELVKPGQRLLVRDAAGPEVWAALGEPGVSVGGRVY